MRIAVGVLSYCRHLGKHIEPSKGTQAVVKVEIHNVGKPLFSDELQGHETHQIVNPGDLFGAVETYLGKESIKV